MSLLPSPAGTTPTPGGPHHEPVLPWLSDATSDSEWLAGIPGLPALAAALRDHTPSVRLRARTRAHEVLHGTPNRTLLRRSARVGLSLLPHTVIGATELQRAAKADGIGLRQWIAQKRAGGGQLATLLERPSGPTEEDAVLAALARRLRLAFESWGPTYVKFGQLLGSAEGLLPPEFVAEFGQCRDEVRPESATVMRREIERRLGPLDTVFAEFDDNPVAAASIAQVHRARLMDGRHVVVKVQRPGIRPSIEQDLALLMQVVRNISRVEMAGVMNLVSMVELFGETTLEELDFRLEADNMLCVGLGLESDDAENVVVPRPIPGLVTSTVLVMELLEGRRVHDVSDDPNARDEALGLVRLGTQAVMRLALDRGLFHGDLHAGNVLMLDNGGYGLLDFGIVGRFDTEQQRALDDWVRATKEGDLLLQLDALHGLGAFPEDADTASLTTELEEAMRGLETAEDLSFEDVFAQAERIATILVRSRLRIPRELALFFKNLFHVNGMVRAVTRRNPDDELGLMLGSVLPEDPGEPPDA